MERLSLSVLIVLANLGDYRRLWLRRLRTRAQRLVVSRGGHLHVWNEG